MPRRIVRTSCAAADVPPYCFLRRGVPVAEAVAGLIASRRFDDPAARITLLWQMRAVAASTAADAE